MNPNLGQIERPSPKQQIIRIIVLLASAICLGCLIVFAMVFSWGPDGSYAVSDVLLAPQTLSQLAYDDASKEQKSFDGVDFQGRPVSLDTYQRFYSLIEKDRSLAETPSHPFNASDTLTLWVRSKAAASSSRQAFQQVEIDSQGNLYRIEKYGSSIPQWLYFERPGIGKNTQQIFMESR